MDLNQVTIVQSRPENQLRFDPDAFDRAVLHAQRRHALIQNLWQKCCTQLNKILTYKPVSSKMVTSRRIG